MKSNQPAATPIPVRRALTKLGGDIRNARRRRRIPTALMAERASISRVTLSKAEKGDPSVSLGTYAKLLFIFGMIDRLADLIDPATDRLGLDLAEEQLPQRIRRRPLFEKPEASYGEKS